MQYYGDEPSLIDVGAVKDFNNNHDSKLFKLRQKIIGQTYENGRKNVEIIVQLKYLSKFWRILEVSLINFEIMLKLTLSGKMCYRILYCIKLRNKICNNWYKTLSSSCKFINSRQCKATTTIEITISMHNLLG